MRVVMAAVCVALGVAACDRPAPLDVQALPAPASTAAAAASADAARARAAADRLRMQIGRSYPTPHELDEQRCDDDAIRAGTSPGDRELSLAVVDSRADGRSVLPLRIKRYLLEPDPSALSMVLAGIDASRSKDAALDDARWLEARRYVGVYHVLDFALPRRFHRPDKRHAEWNAGRLDALFVVHDANSGAALCRKRITILGDATNASLAPRLRSDVRDRLTDTLGKRMRAATAAALARISAVLVLRGETRTASR